MSYRQIASFTSDLPGWEKPTNLDDNFETREAMLRNVSAFKSEGYNSFCVFKLDGSVDLLFVKHVQKRIGQPAHMIVVTGKIIKI